MAVVVATAVGRTFGSGRTAVVALHDVSCTIEPGQRIALVGTSGSGKSTLLHLLAGLDRPTGGTVSWPDIGGIEDLRPGPVGVVFQGPSLLDSLDVLENTALPCLLAGDDPAQARAVARDELDRLGIADLATKLPQELSGGQAQRVAVARAVAGGPRLILADEPTGQLDHVAGRAVVASLVDAARRTDAALVVATHDPAVAVEMTAQWRMADGALTIPGVVARTRQAHP